MASDDAYLRFMSRMIEIHATTGIDHCPRCHEPEPCETMRAVWAYDVARKGGVA